jgi:hypothetical protein
MHVQAPAPIENSLHDTPPNTGCRPVGDKRFKTFLCLLTAVAGQHSYIPVSHPRKFPRGLAAPMTTALLPAGATPFSSSYVAFTRPSAIPARVGTQRCSLPGVKPGAGIPESSQCRKNEQRSMAVCRRSIDQAWGIERLWLRSRQPSARLMPRFTDVRPHPSFRP